MDNYNNMLMILYISSGTYHWYSEQFFSYKMENHKLISFEEQVQLHLRVSYKTFFQDRRSKSHIPSICSKSMFDCYWRAWAATWKVSMALLQTALVANVHRVTYDVSHRLRLNSGTNKDYLMLTATVNIVQKLIYVQRGTILHTE